MQFRKRETAKPSKMCHGNETVLTDGVRMAHVACSLILATLGTFGNALAVAVIYRAQVLRAVPTMMMIIDLCVANMVSTTFILPVIAASSFYKHSHLSNVFCQAYAYIMYVALTTECFILMNITIGQYLVIVHRVSNRIILHHHRCLRLSALLGLPWIITMGVFLVPLTQIWDKFGYDPKKGYCSLLSNEENIGFLGAGAITVISLMTIVTFYCYTAIFCVNFSSQRKITPGIETGDITFKGRARNVQLIKIITMILLNYLITYLPFLVTSVADPCIKNTSLSLYTAIIYISWSHVATNPVIYALMNTRISTMCYSFFASCASNKRASTNLIDGIRERNHEIIINNV